MNSKDPGEPVNLTLPQVIWDDRYDDDISLIDFWIELTRFKKVFLVTFFLVFALGAAVLGVWHEERYTLASVLQIGSVQTDDQIIPLESPEALRGKLVNVMVPSVSALWSEKRETGRKFFTDIELVTDSDVVMIRNDTTLRDIDFFTSFQKQLAEQVIQEHRSKASVYQSGTRSALNTARLRLEVLQNRQALNARLKLIEQEIALERSHFEALQSATPFSPETGRLPSVHADAGGDTARRYQATIRELELRRIELVNEHAQELAQQKSIVQDLERALQDINHTRVISAPVLSLEPVNLSMAKLFAILPVVAGVIASLLTLLALFNEKVRLRRAELAV